MFVDEATIKVNAGDGGNGCMAFRREKFVPRGGPSGGDGGRGGSIILESTEHQNTLIRFRFNPEYRAQRGAHGEGSNRTGRDGVDMIVKVPVGCIVYDAETEEQIKDFQRPKEQFVIARGGRGGRGNARFATSTHRAPREHEPGTPGELRRLKLVLKLLADAGLVGLPNAGKSSLLSRISAAHPKISDYPFTTLVPCLGVVAVDEEESFVMADIPGLIEGAHEGHGLGTRFLRHVERTRVLVHLIDGGDLAESDPRHDFEVIMNELSHFHADLTRKPMILVATKLDLATHRSRLLSIEQLAKEKGLPFLAISSATGKGLDRLKQMVLSTLRRMEVRVEEPGEIGVAESEIDELLSPSQTVVGSGSGTGKRPVPPNREPK